MNEMSQFLDDMYYISKDFISADQKNKWIEAGLNRSYAGLSDKSYNAFFHAFNHYNLSLFLVLINLRIQLENKNNWRDIIDESTMQCIIKNSTCNKKDLHCLFKHFNIDI